MMKKTGANNSVDRHNTMLRAGKRLDKLFLGRTEEEEEHVSARRRISTIARAPKLCAG